MSQRPASARKRLLAVTSPTVAALAATAGIVALAGPAGAQQPTQLLPQVPDLTQDIPRQISVVPARRNGRRVDRLTFRSAAENHGDASAGGGFLVVVGRRTSLGAKTMIADQYVDMFDPITGRTDTQEVHRNVGSMTFEKGGGHSHWHLKGFERYELRNASGKSLVAPDRKTGFCVGNRYKARKRAPSPVRPGPVARPLCQARVRRFSSENY